MFAGITGELFYIRQGIVNHYALTFNIPLKPEIDDIYFNWENMKEPTANLGDYHDVCGLITFTNSFCNKVIRFAHSQSNNTLELICALQTSTANICQNVRNKFKRGACLFTAILNCNTTRNVLFQMFYSMTTIVSKPSVLSNPIFNIPKEGRVPNKLSSKFLMFLCNGVSHYCVTKFILFDLIDV